MTDNKSTRGNIVLEMKGVSKRYPGTLAVDHVDFEARSGEVHALMGENGAGKSTLMKMIAGSFDDYTGEIFIHGEKTDLHSPSYSKTSGIEMIFQELSLALPLSVAENILVGRLPQKAGFILDTAAMVRETRACLERVGLDIDPLQPVEMLSQHEAQLVEIARALGNNPSILVMDEPTSSLSRTEVTRLFEIIRQLKSQGLAIIYISHHISEVFEVADLATVMRDGRKVDSLPIDQLSPDKLVEKMVGRSVGEINIHRALQPGRERFRINGFSRFGFFHDISFHIREGEILGIGGLAGSGRSELARSLCGIDPVDEGQLFLDGKAVIPETMYSCMKNGLSYLTENRTLQGLASNLSSQENTLSALNAKSKRLVSQIKSREIFNKLATEIQIYPPESQRQVNQFSGGNQQKILLAKWLAIAPEVCILDEPTRGVDVGSKQVIHEAIGRLADRGKCVLLISSDLTELVGLSDRIMIMRKGHFIREMQKEEFSEDAVLLAANGESLEACNG